MSRQFERDLEALLAMLEEVRPNKKARVSAIWLIRELAGLELGDEKIGDAHIRALVRTTYPGVKARDPRVAAGWVVICNLLREVSTQLGVDLLSEAAAGGKP